MLNIIIPIKEVPEMSQVRMDEEKGIMIREGTTSIINPLDLYALEAGIRLKEEKGGKVTCITMGPSSAQKSLREALAMGADEGILISSREFAGSDTWATSLVLAEAIKKIGEYQLILTGERAIDGDTGQVGPMIASFLDIPLSTYSSQIIQVKEEEGLLLVERLTDRGYETLSLKLPALITVVKEMSHPRLPTLRGKQRARRMEIPIWDRDLLGIETESVGLKGSPTRVVKTFRPKVSREGSIHLARDDSQIEKGVQELLSFLKKKGLLRKERDHGA